MNMHHDNQVVIYIANNAIFHECPKDIEVDWHFFMMQPHTSSESETIDMFTKHLFTTWFLPLCNKLCIIDIYAPA